LNPGKGGYSTTAALPRLTSLAWRTFTTGSSLRFIIVGILAMFLDLALFLLLLSAGAAIGKAHAMSFSAAAVFFYFFNVRWNFTRSESKESARMTWRDHSSFLVVALLSMFLHGGVLATFTEVAGWPPQAAILPAIAVASAATYAGCAFFVFSWTKKGTLENLRWEVISLGVIGSAFLLRLFYLGITDLLPQEAYYWNYAQHLDIGYLDHPPMVAWAVWLGTYLLGDTEMGVRLFALLAWLVTAFFCFRLTRDFFDLSTAFRALLLLSILPFFFATGFTMTPDSMLVPCWAGLLYYLEQSLLGGNRSAWWGAGVCAGLGMLSKYTIALLVPPVLIFMVIDRSPRRWFLRPEPYGATVLAFLLFTPVIVWNEQHGWASFIFQGSRRFLDSQSFTFPELAGSVLILLTPVGALAALGAMFWKMRTKQGARDISFAARRRFFLSLFTLFPLLFFAAFSLVRTAKLNWTGPLWLATIPLIAWQMVMHEDRRRRLLPRVLQRAWLPTIPVTLLLFGALLHFWSLGLFGLPYPRARDVSLLLGWKDLARKVDQIERDIASSQDGKPLVVGMDKCYISSELAFYRSKNAGQERKEEILSSTTGRHLFGMESLMYRFWFPEAWVKELPRKKPVLILITRELHELNRDQISSRGWEMDRVRELDLKRDGLPVGRYYYALARPK
jgi:dolichol-phosphate mannosyltransferase